MDQFIHPATGEDITKLMDPDWTWFGVFKKLVNRVGNDPKRIPPSSWSGSVRDLAYFMDIPLEEVCGEFGFSEEAIADDLRVEFSTLQRMALPPRDGSAVNEWVSIVNGELKQR